MAGVVTLWKVAFMPPPSRGVWSAPQRSRSCRHSIYFAGDSPFRGSGSGCEGEQPLHVVGHGHEVPLAADVVEAAEQELAEAERRFDDTEHRFGRVLAQRIQRSALRCLQPMRHRLNRRWIGRAWRGWGKALGGPGGGPLAPHRDQRIN